MRVLESGKGQAARENSATQHCDCIAAQTQSKAIAGLTVENFLLANPLGSRHLVILNRKRVAALNVRRGGHQNLLLAAVDVHLQGIACSDMRSAQQLFERFGPAEDAGFSLFHPVSVYEIQRLSGFGIERTILGPPWLCPCWRSPMRKRQHSQEQSAALAADFFHKRSETRTSIGKGFDGDNPQLRRLARCIETNIPILGT